MRFVDGKGDDGKGDGNHCFQRFASPYSPQYRSETTAGPGWIALGIQSGIIPPNGSSIQSTDVPLDYGASGEFRMAARYIDGTTGSEWGYAGPVTETVPPGYALASPPGIIPTVLSDSEIDLSWQATNGLDSGLTVQFGTSPLPNGEGDSRICHGAFTNSGGYNHFLVTGLTPGTLYYFAVSLFNQADGINYVSYGSTSETTSGSDETAPVAPGSLSTSWEVPNEDGVFLHWTNTPNNETGFDVYRYADGTSFDPNTATLLGETSADVTTFDDANADSTQNVIYAVLAMNGAGKSAPVTAPTAKWQDFQVTGFGLDFTLGGGNVKIGKNDVPTSIARKLFDIAADKAKSKLMAAASALTNGLTNYFHALTVADANIQVQGVQDYLQAEGTVAVTVNGVTVNKKVQVEIDLDSAPVPPGGWMLTSSSDCNQLINAIVRLTKATYSRNPKDTAALIESTLEEKAIEEAQGDQ